MSENDFCRMAGIHPPEDLKQQYYGQRDLLSMYPGLRQDHLRYLEKWGLIRPVMRTHTETYFPFSDLLLIRQVSADLESLPFRAILRSLQAERSGQLTFDFAGAPQFALGLDLLDVETGDEIGYFAFYLRGTEVARVTLEQFIDPASSFYDPSIVFGDNSANRVQPMTAQQLNIAAFDKLVIDMGICYGVDNLTFEPFNGTLPAVPEPGALAAMGLAFTALARRRAKP